VFDVAAVVSRLAAVLVDVGVSRLTAAILVDMDGCHQQVGGRRAAGGPVELEAIRAGRQAVRRAADGRLD